MATVAREEERSLRPKSVDRVALALVKQRLAENAGTSIATLLSPLARATALAEPSFDPCYILLRKLSPTIAA